MNHSEQNACTEDPIKKSGTRIGKTLQQVIGAEYAGTSLGTYLKQELKFTRAQIKSIKFRQEGLLVNGKQTRVTAILKKGDLLEVCLEEEKKSSDHLIYDEEEYLSEQDIFYQDEDVIVVWKDRGVVLHPSHGHYSDSLSNRLHGYFEKKEEQVVIRSIGRLDRDTCGLVVFAKNQIAAARLWKQKEEGRFEKEYLALCRGEIPAGSQEICAPIGKQLGNLMKMQVNSENGKHACTQFQVIWSEQNKSLIRVRIKTGRTHQIRVHMAHIGYPLLNDPLYDGLYVGDTEDKMILCAWKVWFEQPFSRKIIVCDAMHKINSIQNTERGK